MRETIQNANGKQFHAVSLSGGKDSSAMLLLMIERDMPIDMVLSADTGIGTFHLLNLLQMADIGQPAVLQHRGQIRGKLRGQCGILTINPIFIGILFSGHIYLQNFEFH